MKAIVSFDFCLMCGKIHFFRIIESEESENAETVAFVGDSFSFGMDLTKPEIAALRRCKDVLEQAIKSMFIANVGRFAPIKLGHNNAEDNRNPENRENMARAKRQRRQDG